MKTELVDLSPTRKEIKIDIDAASVRAEYDRVSDRYAKLVNVPGFRKGRAPREVVRRHYKDEIRSEVLRELLPQAISGAITEFNLNPLAEPDIQLDNDEGLAHIGEQPLLLRAQVEVMPEVVLGDYKGIEVVRRTRPIADADVDRVVESLREESAALDAVEDRGAQIGDTLNVDFHGTFADAAPEDEDINVEDVELVLGGENVLEEMTQNLLDTHPDDERQFTINYPEEFNARGLAGKSVNYQAKVTAVRIKVLPEADDEWARSVGEGAESLAELREQIRTRLTESARAEAERNLRDELMEKLVAAHQVEIPARLLEHQTQHLLESTLYEMMQRGYDPREANINWENLRAGMRDRAEQELRGSLLLERIAEREQIVVSDEEVEDEINKIAEAMQQTTDQVRAALTKQGGERSIADRLRVRRTLDLLVENARVTDEEWREEEEAPAVEATMTTGDMPAGGDEPTTEQETADLNSAATSAPQT